MPPEVAGRGRVITEHKAAAAAAACKHAEPPFSLSLSINPRGAALLLTLLSHLLLSRAKSIHTVHRRRRVYIYVYRREFELDAICIRYVCICIGVASRSARENIYARAGANGIQSSDNCVTRLRQEEEV